MAAAAAAIFLIVVVSSPEIREISDSRVIGLFYDWQTLIAAAFVVFTVIATYDVDRQRRTELDQRIETLSQALAIEVALVGKELSDIVLLMINLGGQDQTNEGLARLRSVTSLLAWSGGTPELYHLPKPLLVVCYRVIWPFIFKKDLAEKWRSLSLRPALKIKRLVL